MKTTSKNLLRLILAFGLVVFVSSCGTREPGLTDVNSDDSTGTVPQPPTPTNTDVPEFAGWESEMTEFGGNNCAFIQNTVNPLNARQDAVYYDATLIFYQIYDYTRDSAWLDCVQTAKEIYRDGMSRVGFLQGNWKFPHGIYEDFKRGGDTTIQDIIDMRDKHAFSEISEFQRENEYKGEYTSMSREVAYTLQANIFAERAAQQRVMENGKSRVQSLVEFAENHLFEWRNGLCSHTDPTRCRFAPFMFALTGHALIDYFEWETESGRDPNTLWPKTHWQTIEAALADVATWARNNAKDTSGRTMWVDQGAYGTFRYSDVVAGGSGQDPAPDLNQLIATTYYWAAMKTNNSFLRDVGDDLFGGAVLNAFIGQGKQFNQNYRTSFMSLRYR